MQRRRPLNARTHPGEPHHASGRPQGHPKPRHHNNFACVSLPATAGFSTVGVEPRWRSRRRSRGASFFSMPFSALVAWADGIQMFSAVCLWVKTPAAPPRIAPAVLDRRARARPRATSWHHALLCWSWWAIAFAPLANIRAFRGRAASVSGRLCGLILAGNIMGPVAFSLAIADGSLLRRPRATCAMFGQHPSAQSSAGSPDDPTAGRSLTAARASPRCAAVAVVRRADDLACPRGRKL